MAEAPLSRRLVAEALGTLLLLATVVGSGIMGERLAAGNAAVALLANTMATYAALVVLILGFGPISGAHFNPAVSAYFALRKEMPWREWAGYSVAQILGGILGVWLAHAMFAEAIFQAGVKPRNSGGELLGEVVATFGLILTIILTARHRPQAVPMAVGSYIAAAYWFTSSTSFANPAAAIARSLTTTFAGIRPADMPGFIGAELVGMLLAAGFLSWFLARPSPVRGA